MRTFNVVFHRHYEIKEEDLLEYQDDFDTPEAAAEYVALELLGDDIVEFIDNVDGFATATIEVKNDK